MSFVLYTQILKKSVLKPASSGITLSGTDVLAYEVKIFIKRQNSPMWVTLIGIVKRKTLRSRTTINTSGTYLQADCKVETFLLGERGKI